MSTNTNEEVKTISTTNEKIAQARTLLDEIETEVAAQAQQAQAASAQSQTVVDSPEVMQAAQAFASALARSQGVDLPLAAVDGTQGVPAFVLPEQFTEMGGVGIGVLMQAPTEAARRA